MWVEFDGPTDLSKSPDLTAIVNSKIFLYHRSSFMDILYNKKIMSSVQNITREIIQNLSDI